MFDEGPWLENAYYRIICNVGRKLRDQCDESYRQVLMNNLDVDQLFREAEHLNKEVKDSVGEEELHEEDDDDDDDQDATIELGKGEVEEGDEELRRTVYNPEETGQASPTSQEQGEREGQAGAKSNSAEGITRKRNKKKKGALRKKANKKPRGGLNIGTGNLFFDYDLSPFVVNQLQPFPPVSTTVTTAANIEEDEEQVPSESNHSHVLFEEAGVSSDVRGVEQAGAKVCDNSLLLLELETVWRRCLKQEVSRRSSQASPLGLDISNQSTAGAFISPSLCVSMSTLEAPQKGQRPAAHSPSSSRHSLLPEMKNIVLGRGKLGLNGRRRDGPWESSSNSSESEEEGGKNNNKKRKGKATEKKVPASSSLIKIKFESGGTSASRGGIGEDGTSHQRMALRRYFRAIPPPLSWFDNLAAPCQYFLQFCSAPEGVALHQPRSSLQSTGGIQNNNKTGNNISIVAPSSSLTKEEGGILTPSLLAQNFSEEKQQWIKDRYKCEAEIEEKGKQLADYLQQQKGNKMRGVMGTKGKAVIVKGEKGECLVEHVKPLMQSNGEEGDSDHRKTPLPEESQGQTHSILGGMYKEEVLQIPDTAPPTPKVLTPAQPPTAAPGNSYVLPRVPLDTTNATEAPQKQEIKGKTGDVTASQHHHHHHSSAGIHRQYQWDPEHISDKVKHTISCRAIQIDPVSLASRTSIVFYLNGNSNASSGSQWAAHVPEGGRNQIGKVSILARGILSVDGAGEFPFVKGKLQIDG